MKKILILLLFLTTVSASYAQDKPVHWYFSSRKVAAETYELHMKAMMDPPYHIYGQDLKSEVGVPTTVRLSMSPLYVIIGKPVATGELKTHKDGTTGETLSYYPDEVDFVQVVKLKRKGKVTVKGTASFMACTDDHCLPEDKQNFKITVGQ